MQKLHLVGFTTDHRGLIFSVRRNAKSGGYTVELDASLVEAVDELRALIAEETAAEQAPAATRPESALTVREVQVRLRRGRTIEQVAREAGVDASWIARFAPPVLAEQSEIIRSARATKMVKQRIVSGATLGDSVYRNLVDRGVSDPRAQLDKSWSARQLTEGAWLVTFKYTARGKVNEASWEFDSEAGTLRTRSRLGTQLGFREPRRSPRPAPAPAKPARRATPTKKTTPTSRKSQARAAKRLAAARKAATARMVSEAERATKRNVQMARKAAKKPIVVPPRRFEPPPPPPPEPEPEPETELELELEEIDEPEEELAEVEEFDEIDDVVEDEIEPEPEPLEEAADEKDELAEEPVDEFEVLRRSMQPARRKPLRASRADEPSAAERARRRVFVQADPVERDENAGNGPVFRSDLARPASEQSKFPLSGPARPLEMPEPIEPPPRRRRIRPLRGR